MLSPLQRTQACHLWCTDKGSQASGMHGRLASELASHVSTTHRHQRSAMPKGPSHLSPLLVPLARPRAHRRLEDGDKRAATLRDASDVATPRSFSLLQETPSMFKIPSTHLSCPLRLSQLPHPPTCNRTSHGRQCELLVCILQHDLARSVSDPSE